MLSAVHTARAVPSSPHRLQLLQSVRRGVGRAARVTGAALAGVLLSAGLAFGATSATFGSVPLIARFKYAFSRFLVNNGFGVVLLSFVGFALLGGFLYAITKSGGDTFGDSAFKAYTLLNNVPGADATADESLAGKLVSQLMYTIHVATFAIIIGIVSDKISCSVDSLRTTNERVQEVGHTVIVNWGDFTRPMMRQLEAARLEGRLSGPVVVISETDKAKMDEVVTDELTRMRAGLNVLTRQVPPR